MYLELFISHHEIYDMYIVHIWSAFFQFVNSLFIGGSQIECRNCFFSDALASLALMIVTDWLTYRNWRFLKFNSSVTIRLVLHTWKYYVWSVWSPDQTRVSNWEMYLSQIGKCICLKLGNVFVSNWEMYLSQIAKCTYVHICSKWPNVFVPNC